LLRQFEYDAVLVEETNLMENLPPDLAVPLIFDHHNAEHILLRRYVQHAESPVRALYALLEAEKTKHWELHATRRASAVLVCSDEDRRIYRNLVAATPAFVVPNVIDTDHYIPRACTDENNHTVLYTGGMDWHPNRDAVRYFAREILPEVRRLVPDMNFVVAGRNAPSEYLRELSSVPGIRFTGTLPDMRPEIAAAAVCVVPLRIGSGTRLKILEAAAMAKAIVSTSIGAEGLDFVNGEEIILADAPFQFADAVASLLTHDNRRNRFGCAARKRVEAMYGLPAMRAAVEDLCRSMAKCPGQ